MPPMTKQEAELESFDIRVRGIFARMQDLLHKKQESYGRLNLYRRGLLGMIVRLEDKIERLVTMADAETTTNADGDSMRDAMNDIIGYAVMMQIWAEDTGLLETPTDFPQLRLRNNSVRDISPGDTAGLKEELTQLVINALVDLKNLVTIPDRYTESEVLGVLHYLANEVIDLCQTATKPTMLPGNNSVRDISSEAKRPIMIAAKDIRDEAFLRITDAIAREDAGVTSSLQLSGEIMGTLESMYGKLAVAFGIDTGQPTTTGRVSSADWNVTQVPQEDQPPVMAGDASFFRVQVDPEAEQRRKLQKDQQERDAAIRQRIADKRDGQEQF